MAIMTIVNAAFFAIKLKEGARRYYFALGGGCVGSFALSFWFSNIFLKAFFIFNGCFLFYMVNKDAKEEENIFKIVN